MKHHRISCVALLGTALTLQAQIDLSYVGQVALPGGGEIIAYTADAHTLATTYFTGSSAGSTQGVNLYNFNGAATSFRTTVDFSTVFGASNTFSVSSVALDPLGRDFGVATIIPTANTSTVSKLAFFNYHTGSLLHTVDVGFHADSVTFARDGSRLVVANEGEANAGTSAANDGSDGRGSISLISLAGISQANQVGSIGSANTVDFSAGNLSAAAAATPIRDSYQAGLGNVGNTAGQQTFINSVPTPFPGSANPTGVEPEYAVVHGTKVYASLQENNAIGVFDTATNKWENIYNLGTIAQAIDATDSDGVPSSPTVVHGLPMPDTLAVTTIGGRDYIVTANEGDARIDDRDISRFGDTSGGDSMNPLLDPSLPATATGIRSNTALGRLNVSRIDGDTDGDGDIDRPTMLGTRSFSIWDAQTGALVADSGNLETVLLGLDPTRHNINREANAVDNRSDDKGPEPEALTVLTSGDQTLVAVGLERQNGILLYNISNPVTPFLVYYINGRDHNLVSPESLLYIAASDNPTGMAYVLGGYEGVDGTGALAGIGIYAATPVPEPSTYGLIAAGALGALALWRRRRCRA